MSSRTKPQPMTAEEIEKQAEQYHQLALSDHMDAGRFAQAHASLLNTAAQVRYLGNQHLTPGTLGPMRAEEAS
jgi:hypothetical protein